MPRSHRGFFSLVCVSPIPPFVRQMSVTVFSSESEFILMQFCGCVCAYKGVYTNLEMDQPLGMCAYSRACMTCTSTHICISTNIAAMHMSLFGTQTHMQTRTYTHIHTHCRQGADFVSGVVDDQGRSLMDEYNFLLFLVLKHCHLSLSLSVFLSLTLLLFLCICIYMHIPWHMTVSTNNAKRTTLISWYLGVHILKKILSDLIVPRNLSSASWQFFGEKFQ